jgi:hypothetical protein
MMGFRKLNMYGQIPEGNSCPYRDACFAAHNDGCGHTNVNIPHDCHVAKLTDYSHHNNTKSHVE